MKRFTNANKLFMNEDDYYKKYQEAKNDKGIIVRSYDKANDKDILLKDCMLAIEQKDDQIEELKSDRRYYINELNKEKRLRKEEGKIDLIIKIVFCILSFVLGMLISCLIF